RAQVAADKGLGKMPPNRRKPVIIASAAVLTLLLVIVAGVSIPRNESAAVQAREAAGQWDLIPPEELFLPNEPDFVPEVLLGREQRTEWTVEDAEPWWQNPLVEGEEQWRYRIERMVDEIMESVP
ncbi:MAG: hypothetical protein FWD88_01305, partial [Treponema sp.]|nr:hypothetical protein [Treponema sp.]